jgi:hypothetical protein
MHCNMASEQSLNAACQFGVVTLPLSKSTTISGAIATGEPFVAQPLPSSSVVRAIRRNTATG